MRKLAFVVKFAALFALCLVANASFAAQVWPEKEGRQFIPDSATQKIRLCRPTLGCTPSKTFAVQQWNCGYWNFPGNFPLDNTYSGYCEPEPTVVVPPVTPPVTPPVIPPTIPAPVRIAFCGFSMEALFKDLRYRIVDISNPNFVGYPYAILWQCPNKAVQVAPFTKKERESFIDTFGKDKSIDKAKVQAWIDAQPLDVLTKEQDAYLNALRVAYIPHYEVLTEQKVYPKTAGGAKSSVSVKYTVAGVTKEALVKPGAQCWSSDRIGTTKYYRVSAAVREDKTLIPMTPAYYALCEYIDPFAN